MCIYTNKPGANIVTFRGGEASAIQLRLHSQDWRHKNYARQSMYVTNFDVDLVRLSSLRLGLGKAMPA